MTKRVVVASGYFNPLHYGHVSYLEKARDCGTSLIVIVNNDRQAARRSSGEMSLPARERVKLIRSLQCVDAAVEAMDEDESVAETLRVLHPDIFANGGGTKPTQKECDVCQELGIQMYDGLGIQVLSLKPFTQHYDWGKPRNLSIIAELTGQQTPEKSDAEALKPFAEMWMGDHPSGPASLESPLGDKSGLLSDLQRKTSLKDLLQRTPSVLGRHLENGAQLPFLLKVLSIHKALSIQAHPDRELATRLHKERPDVYKDPNHKPEIAIALTDDFQALCGFRPISEIVEMLDHVPELVILIGDAAAKGLREAGSDAVRAASALKTAYSTMMHAPSESVEEQSKALIARTSKPAWGTPQMVKAAFELTRKLHDQFGDDIGIFSVFFMNHVHMAVGECLYMAQNVPHAYLSGDIVECMACSDNVVRGGLTPKFKDIEVLCDMLNYTSGPPATVKPQLLERGIQLYADADIAEFQVTHLHLDRGETRRRLFSKEGPAMAFACKGHGTVTISGESQEIATGKVFMLAAGVEPEITAKNDLDVFVACCPPQYFRPPQRKVSKNSHLS
eukprot:TRINITY_DN110687_c0_g1_i1.p1 TRINITY_DN110687_c0_g1~~TRINITY_DN110687_c0_g1_i1.p1  ORF type:complete len:561 (-),score=125.48 TRINITY_DN110687_c0_g1_i1:21-1703(-)